MSVIVAVVLVAFIIAGFWRRIKRALLWLAIAGVLAAVLGPEGALKAVRELPSMLVAGAGSSQDAP